MKKLSECVPLIGLEKLKRKFPLYFKWVEEFRENKRSDLYWPKEFCYCPIDLTRQFLKSTYPELIQSDDFHKVERLLPCYAAWSKSKEVYELDQSLAETFADQWDSDISVTSDLITIPSWCIYVKTGIVENCDGFLMTFEYNVIENRKELEIYILANDGEVMAPFSLVIPNEPMELSALLKNQMVEFNMRNARRDVLQSEEQFKKYFEISRKMIRFSLAVLLYLSASNAEVKVKKAGSSRKPSKKHEASAITSYDVGKKTGIHIRKMHKYLADHSEESLGGHHRSPVMHVRRAHYHTFLYGEGKTKRRVKWLPPIIVNAEGKEVDFVTVTEVK